MKYTEFVKENMPKVKHLEPKERMKEIAKLWRESKLGNPGKKVKAGRPRKATVPKVKKTPQKTQGSGIFGDIGNVVDGVGSLFGLGLKNPPKKEPTQLKKPRTRKNKFNKLSNADLMRIISLAHKNGSQGGDFNSFADNFFKGLSLPFRAAASII